MPPARLYLRTRMPAHLSLALALVITLLAPALTRATPPQDYRIVEDLRYTPPGWPADLAGDLYLPERTGLRPVVLVVHGGSWKGGDRASFDARRIARHLATQGYAAFSVDYRLAPAARYPAPLADLQQAVAWLRANAATHGLDPDAIGAWGYSAGGHLVAMLGTKWNAPARLRAVVAGGTPADLTALPDSGAVTTFLGKSVREDPALAADASPLFHVGAGTPPFFLYHGATDGLVEPGQAQRFAAALKAKGVTVDVLYLRHFGHLRTALFPGRALAQGVAFLERHLAPARADSPVEAGNAPDAAAAANTL